MIREMCVAAVAVALSVSSAQAATLKAGSPACLTEELTDQLYDAVLAKDLNALDWLSKNGCSISDKPLEATVLGLSEWGSLAHIRAYRGNHAIEVWTSRADLEGYDPLNP